MTKTLIEQPLLKIQAGADGVWLHFTASSGMSASLNLLLQSHGKIVNDALLAWATEYAKKAD